MITVMCLSPLRLVMLTAPLDKQRPTHATLTENQYTHPILEDNNYRKTLPLEAKTFELTAATVKSSVQQMAK